MLASVLFYMSTEWMFFVCFAQRTLVEKMRVYSVTLYTADVLRSVVPTKYSVACPNWRRGRPIFMTLIMPHFGGPKYRPLRIMPLISCGLSV